MIIHCTLYCFFCFIFFSQAYSRHYIFCGLPQVYQNQGILSLCPPKNLTNPTALKTSAIEKYYHILHCIIICNKVPGWQALKVHLLHYSNPQNLRLFHKFSVCANHLENGQYTTDKNFHAKLKKKH